MPMEQFEVVVVDDGSTDGTAQIFEEEMQRSHLRLRCFSKAHEGPGAARNYGVEKAEGALIAFIEDDVSADRHWLSRALKHLEDPDITGIEGTTVAGSSRGSLRLFDPGDFFSFIPCNFFIRRDAFLALHGYDTEFFDGRTNLYFREDIEFGFRVLHAGLKIASAPDVIVSHPAQFHSAGDAFRHVRRYFFDPLLYQKHPRDYRRGVEVKAVGPLRLHRPFHYLSLFYILAFMLIFPVAAVGNVMMVVGLLIFLLILFAGIRFRYQRTWFPLAKHVLSAAPFLFLPFYYYYWLIRGCRRYGSWGPLI